MSEFWSARRIARPFLIVSMLWASAGLWGCFMLPESREVSLAAVDRSAELVITPTLGAYAAIDTNTADIYLTDLPEAAFADGADWSQYSGSVIHIHMFLRPTPGYTPIAVDASSATVRQLLIAQGEMGLYGGGGFLSPRSAVGDESFEGRVRDATLKLLDSTPGFVDRVGPAEFNTRFDVLNDPRAAFAIDAMMDRAIASIRSGTPTPTPTPTPQPASAAAPSSAPAPATSAAAGTNQPVAVP